MTKKIKSIFFVLTLITLLAIVGAVCAADDANSTTTTDSSVSDVATVTDTASDQVAAEPLNTNSNDNKFDTKTIEKEEKNLKKDSITINEIEYSNTYENQELNDNVFTTLPWVPDLGVFQIDENTYINNCNITGINTARENRMQLFNEESYVLIDNSRIEVGIDNSAKLTLNNSIILMDIMNDGIVTVKNSTLNSKINNYGVLIIDDYTVIGENFQLDGEGEVIINDTSRLPQQILSQYNGTYTLKNVDISKIVTNYGNLTLINSNMTTQLINYGNLTIIDSKIDAYLMQRDNATATIINSTITRDLQVVGNTTIYNSECKCNITINTNSKLTLNNDTLYQRIYNNEGSTVIISDDTIFEENFTLQRGVDVIINDTDKIIPYLFIYNDTYILANIEIKTEKQNYGTLTIRNSTMNSRILNNDGACLIIENDVTFGENLQIAGTGTIIINDTDKVAPYLTILNGTYTISDNTITDFKTNYGNLTVNNTTITNSITNQYGILIINNSNINGRINNNNGGEVNITNSIITNTINNYGGLMTFSNCTLNSTIQANDDIIITDDCIYGENLKITGRGEVIVNDTDKILPYLESYHGEYTFENVNLNTSKTNYGTITYINSTLNATITNIGTLIIDDECIIGENFKVTGDGDIIINDTNKIALYINKYNGTYTLENMNINDPKTNYGNMTLNNCTITQPLTNYGNITINNCTINVASEIPWLPSYYLTNYGTAYIREDNNIINGRITSSGEIIYTTLPKPETYIVTNETLHEYFTNDETGNLTDIVKTGDTLDFQGTITANHSLTVNKPINIVSTTQNAYVDLNTTAGSLLGESQGASFVINNDGSYSNLTGIYFHNTQLWFYNTHYVTINNISAVVEDQQIGSGVGQTSIRANSTYVTIKNSYIYTRNNGGSSSLVLAWADYCTVENCTIQGGGGNGNLLYLTTWNVDVPEGTIANSNNKLINNTIKGNGSAISWGIVLSGVNNTVDGNTIYSNSAGIEMQWGGDPIMGETVSTLGNITVCNNKLIGGCGISIGNYIYNNYVEGAINSNNALIVNNTANRIEVSNNTRAINNTVTSMNIGENTPGTNPIVENNNIETLNIGRYTTNATITLNNITNQISINGTYCNITNNTIITDNEYTITGRGKDNIITDNYLISSNKVGDKSVSLDKNTNTIANNTPYETILKVDTTTFTIGKTSTITASIYYGDDINTNITKGKVTFKVNGKTLKDANGKIIYAKVVNGTATIENYLIPDDWAKDGTTIQAVYSGSNQLEKISSEKTEITLTTPKPTLTITPITSDVQTGSTVTLKAKVATGDKAITTGKIVFKVNGKIVKDANGKVIYAKVDSNGEVSVDYTIPESSKARTYDIEAVFTASGYEKLTGNTTMTVVKT
ncbi:MAG: hypothetical protein IKF79_00790 [Methanosphaera sp.]|nr:hypothetical protein [Methanosphaera sp.]